jgi:hypothetical protein
VRLYCTLRHYQRLRMNSASSGSCNVPQYQKSKTLPHWDSYNVVNHQILKKFSMESSSKDGPWSMQRAIIYSNIGFWRRVSLHGVSCSIAHCLFLNNDRLLGVIQLLLVYSLFRGSSAPFGTEKWSECIRPSTILQCVEKHLVAILINTLYGITTLNPSSYS